MKEDWVVSAPELVEKNGYRYAHLEAKHLAKGTVRDWVSKPFHHDTLWTDMLFECQREMNMARVKIESMEP